MGNQTFLRTEAAAALELMFSACDQERPYTVFDVRDPHSFGHGHLPGAISLGEGGVREWLGKLPKSEPVFVYCKLGFSSQTFAKRFADAGFTEVHSIDGGFVALVKAFGDARARALAAAPTVETKTTTTTTAATSSPAATSVHAAAAHAHGPATV